MQIESVNPISLCLWVFVRECRGGVRFSNNNRIIPSNFRILFLLGMPIPNGWMDGPMNDGWMDDGEMDKWMDG